VQVNFALHKLVMLSKDSIVDEIGFESILACEPDTTADGQPKALRVSFKAKAHSWECTSPTSWLEFLTMQTLIMAAACDVSPSKVRQLCPHMVGLENEVVKSGEWKL
jgi:hypothetical protein